jgi:small subunit ribosomal protein S4
VARVLGAKCRLCRREATKLFLRGSRCDTMKCAMEREKRSKPPGQHGDKRSRLTDYGVHLREKQKVKWMYGLMDRQFMRYFDVAQGMPGNTGENLLLLLERRLDNVLYRLGFAASRSQARQMITHGKVTLNARRIYVPSFWVKAGDMIKPIDTEVAKNMILENLKIANRDAVPGWLSIKDEPLEGQVLQLPKREEITVPINEQLIVEFCSR